MMSEHTLRFLRYEHLFHRRSARRIGLLLRQRWLICSCFRLQISVHRFDHGGKPQRCLSKRELFGAHGFSSVVLAIAEQADLDGAGRHRDRHRQLRLSGNARIRQVSGASCPRDRPSQSFLQHDRRFRQQGLLGSVGGLRLLGRVQADQLRHH